MPDSSLIYICLSGSYVYAHNNHKYIKYVIKISNERNKRSLSLLWAAQVNMESIKSNEAQFCCNCSSRLYYGQGSLYCMENQQAIEKSKKSRYYSSQENDITLNIAIYKAKREEL